MLQWLQMKKLETTIIQFEEALKNLDNVLKQNKNEFIIDAAILRFKITFDLAWKAIKTCLEENKGVICKSPKGCFKDAYEQGIIEYDEFWIEMTDARNRTAHTYEEITAEEIFSLLPKTLEYFKRLLEGLKDLSK